MTILIREIATYEPCPVCEGWNPECWLCKGKGQIPRPEASYLSSGQAYSNSWWACGCFKNYLHPENHEYCEICGISHEEGGDAFSAEAVLFVATLRTRIGDIALPEFSEKELV